MLAVLALGQESAWWVTGSSDGAAPGPSARRGHSFGPRAVADGASKACFLAGAIDCSSTPRKRSVRWVGGDPGQGAAAHVTQSRVAVRVIPDQADRLFERPGGAASPFQIVAPQRRAELLPAAGFQGVPGTHEVQSRIGRCQPADVENSVKRPFSTSRLPGITSPCVRTSAVVRGSSRNCRQVRHNQDTSSMPWLRAKHSRIHCSCDRRSPPRFVPVNRRPSVSMARTCWTNRARSWPNATDELASCCAATVPGSQV